MDHHTNMSFTHKCVNGVDLRLEFFTFEADDVTEKDHSAARAVDAILEEEKINMSDYSYNLKLDSIAKYPAEPRGSSRLVRVDRCGKVSHYDNFSNSFLPLAENAHIVFNDSRLVNARLSVVGKESTKSVEMMVLYLGGGVSKKCNDTKLNVMLRQEGVKIGDLFVDNMDGTTCAFRVSEVIGPWIEDDYSNGMGTE